MKNWCSSLVFDELSNTWTTSFEEFRNHYKELSDNQRGYEERAEAMLRRHVVERLPAASRTHAQPPVHYTATLHRSNGVSRSALVTLSANLAGPSLPRQHPIGHHHMSYWYRRSSKLNPRRPFLLYLHGAVESGGG